MPEPARARFVSGFDKRSLTITLALFFAALVVPTGVLVYQAFGQLKSEALYQHRVLAEELADRIDARLRKVMAIEEGRSLTDYRFLVVQGNARANFLQRSPLAGFPVDSAIPGLLAYFQIDADGSFSTPLLPSDADPATYGIAPAEVEQRRALEERVRALLTSAPGGAALPAAQIAAPVSSGLAATEPDRRDSALAKEAKARSDDKRSDEGNSGQAVFDRLSEPESPAPAMLVRQMKQAALDAPRVARKEQAVVPEVERAAAGALVSNRVRTFEGELDPFVLRRLDGDHFVLFRKVWLDGRRLIQGAVIAQNPFVDGLISAPFRETTLSQTSDVVVTYRDDVIGSVAAPHGPRYSDTVRKRGDPLYRTALPAPLGDIELTFRTNQLPIGPGGRIIGWTTLVLAVVLCIGFVVVYRFGAAQIALNRQQQDFVSAVSHELKTPLTSIRMYGEILKAGWASEEKKKTYYDFIFHESERLSRLIANVLRLARLTRNGDSLDMKRVTSGELLNLVESKVLSQVEQAGFTLEIVRDPVAADTAIVVDADSFVQILINLVDNALKFSARAQRKTVEIGCRAGRDRVEFRVRDYGSGIAPRHLKQIFKLFYRAQDELTRETAGTGIGLALVRELTDAMGGSVDVHNCEPGAEFTVSFPIAPN
jgi:signal transduction histidine kinase